MYDVIIIGGGPAGFTAALYTARAKLNTLVVEKAFFGGQMALTNQMENYPGLDEGISGSTLADKMVNQAVRFGAKVLIEEAIELELGKTVKIVKTKENTYEAKTVILCMGASPRKLGLPNEEKLTGFGVSYCATCDGAFFRGKDVAVIGGGNTAAGDALYLSRLCNKVYLVHRRNEMRATKVLVDSILNNPRIDPVWNSTVEEILGDTMVEGIKIRNTKSQECSLLNVRGIFVAIGHIPNTQMVKGQIELNAEGYIRTDDKMRTNIPGVFAAGDIREKYLRQVITAASDGATAGQSVENYLTENKL